MDKRFLALAMALMLVLAIMVSPVPGIADAGSFSGVFFVTERQKRHRSEKRGITKSK